MQTQDIVQIIEHSLVTASTYFESVATGQLSNLDGNVIRMPEYWITAKLMQDLHKQGLAAFPEVRINEDIEYFEFGGGRFLGGNDFCKLKGAKIDLFICDRSSRPGNLRLRVALEIKSMKSSWSAVRADLDRLQELKRVAAGNEQEFIFAYVSGPLLDKEKVEEDKNLEKYTRLSLNDFKVRKSLRPSVASTEGCERYSYSYLHRC